MAAHEMAVLWVPTGAEARRWERVNIEYCETCRYPIVGVIAADPLDAARWDEVHRMAGRYEFDVLEQATGHTLPHDPLDGCRHSGDSSR